MKEAEAEFFKYTNPYRKYGDKILLKINHTVRVKELCIDIAKSLNLSKEDIDLAAMCGLLHDIGRFEQWKKYKTYDDLKSIDHGELGVEILTKNNFINTFTKTNHNTILRAVKYHNRYSVPKTLNERNKLFVDITRDADKIDILNLFVTGGLVTNSENTKMTDKVYNSLLKKELIKIEDVKTKSDQIGVRIGFIFDINYKKSFEIIKERNLLNDMIYIQIKEASNKDLINQLNELKDYCNKYIEEMIKC